jgi:hypothetical protein
VLTYTLYCVAMPNRDLVTSRINCGGTAVSVVHVAIVNLLHIEVTSKAYITYSLTSWSIVLENLTGSQLVKGLPSFYETRRFMTAFTSDRHLSLL